MLQQPGKKEWLPYAGFVLTVAGMIWQGGVMSAQIDSNTDRITQLEARNRESVAKLEQMNIRGENNAAKLDFLVAAAAEKGKR